ncbi:MAG TPA: HD-GYP domain-containing protein, partial [Dehalococcoidia bacterium]
MPRFSLPMLTLAPDSSFTTRACAVISIVIVPVIAVGVMLRGLIELPTMSGTDLLTFAGLAVATMLAVRAETEIGQIVLSGEWVVTMLAVIVMPQVAPLLGACVLLGTFNNWRGRIVSTSNELVTLGAASIVIGMVGRPVSTGEMIGSLTLVTAVMVAVNFITMVPPVVAFATTTLREYAPVALTSAAATFLLALPISIAASFGLHAIGPWFVLFTLVPLVAMNYFHNLYRRTLDMRDELADKAQILARTNLQFAAAMVRALDTRDAYTAGHSAAVAVYTRDIAREMGFDDETVRLAHLAGLLHDIGKIGVPGRVLNKQSPLDDEEYELMKTHAAMGAEILGEVDLYADIAVLVRYHHERIDGRGYPDGISGEAIPAISRMISVADTYSAMTTDRPYRDGMPTEKAMSILRECRGTQLDSDFTDAFLRILIVADAEYQRGKQTDFEVEVAKHQALSQVEAEAVRIDAP